MLAQAPMACTTKHLLTQTGVWVYKTFYTKICRENAVWWELPRENKELGALLHCPNSTKPQFQEPSWTSGPTF